MFFFLQTLNCHRRILNVVVQIFSAQLQNGSSFTEVKAVFACLQLVWLGINAFLFVHFYMVFLLERWFYTRVLLGVSPSLSIFEPRSV